MGNLALELLELMSEKRASDLHIKVGRPPMFRTDGKLTAMAGNIITEEEANETAYNFMTPTQRERFANTNEMDLAYSPNGTTRYRINVFRQKGTVELVIRAILKNIPTLEDLHLPMVLKKNCFRTQGAYSSHGHGG
ncbi:MAG: hypothetical protein WCI43_03840 [Candidatus Firestonebacteria bacterium]